MAKGRHPRAIVCAAVFLVIGCYGIAETGVHDDRVVFGQSAAFTGPSSALGLNMRKGIEAAFGEVNEEGGVYGRQLVLISLDDAYEPEAAIENTRSLIEQNVFALIGAVGTPTSRSAVPVAEEAGNSLSVALYRGRILAKPVAAKRHECSSVICAGNRGHG